MQGVLNMNYSILDFNVMGDNRGSLISLEENKNIPFDIKRVYYIFDTAKDVVRGNHSHQRIEQVIVCVKGSCKFMLDDGKEKQEVHLSSPCTGLYIGQNIWRQFSDFSEDCVLMVLASEFYDEKEYIRNYDEFLKTVESN